MRIGIVTQPLEMNYGGILQNWALQQSLKKLGHEPVTIDAYQRYSTMHYAYNWLRVALKRIQGRKAKFPTRYCGALRSQLMGQFIEQHIAKTRVMWEYKKSIVPEYALDALVVGSDQVWRAAYNGDHIENMYLRFAQGLQLKKRVAYAASFGVDHWEYTEEQTATCAALAQRFDAVSVREASGVDLCREHLGVNAEHVLDPTLLLTLDDYQSIIDQNWESGKPYLAVYCLDNTPDKKAFFDKMAADRGLTVRYFSAGWQSTLTVGQWLAMIKHASLVVTDSFHGTAFSIIFNRDFYTLENPKRGNTRMTDLLTPLGLEQRLVPDAASAGPVRQEINWQDVNARTSEAIAQSLEFLASALNG